MKRINEKLIDIDLSVDIESKTDFRPEKSWFGGKVSESSVPIKSHPQYQTSTEYSDFNSMASKLY